MSAGLVSRGTVHEFVDETGRDQEAGFTGTHPALMSVCHVAHRVVSVRDSGMREVRHIESGTGIPHQVHQHPSRPQARDLHPLGGVELAAVLHRIQEDLAKVGASVLAVVLAEIIFVLG